MPAQTELIVPFFKQVAYPLGIVGFVVMTYFVIVGTSNSVNLTDGLDGLATLCVITVAVAFGLIAYFAGHAGIAEHLGLPRVRGAEIDLILRERDGTLVFCEVRARRGTGHGGAAASVTPAKQRRIVRAASHYLMRFPQPPPCRFDVVAIDADQLHWIQAAFDG